MADTDRDELLKTLEVVAKRMQPLEERSGMFATPKDVQMLALGTSCIVEVIQKLEQRIRSLESADHVGRR